MLHSRSGLCAGWRSVLGTCGPEPVCNGLCLTPHVRSALLCWGRPARCLSAVFRLSVRRKLNNFVVLIAVIAAALHPQCLSLPLTGRLKRSGMYLNLPSSQEFKCNFFFIIQACLCTCRLSCTPQQVVGLQPWAVCLLAISAVLSRCSVYAALPARSTLSMIKGAFRIFI